MTIEERNLYQKIADLERMVIARDAEVALHRQRHKELVTWMRKKAPDLWKAAQRELFEDREP